MGILDRLFGQQPDYPPLPENGRAREHLEAVRTPLDELAHRVNDPLEVVAADGDAFVFLGKPPKRFGIAWLHDGKVVGVKEMVAEGHLTQADAGRMISEIGDAYAANDGAPRYAATIGGRQVTVIDSDDLEHRVQRIVETVTHH